MIRPSTRAHWALFCATYFPTHIASEVLLLETSLSSTVVWIVAPVIGLVVAVAAVSLVFRAR